MSVSRIITATVALGYLFGASQVGAQSLKEMIVGSWKISAVFDEYQDGEKKDNWGGAVKGQLTFESNGRFTQIIIGAPVPAMKTDDPRKPDAPVVAYYGSYTVDDAGKRIVGKIEGAAHSSRVNTDSGWIVQGSGDKLTLIGPPRKDQHGTFSPKLEVVRQ